MIISDENIQIDLEILKEKTIEFALNPKKILEYIDLNENILNYFSNVQKYLTIKFLHENHQELEKIGNWLNSNWEKLNSYEKEQIIKYLNLVGIKII